MRRTSYWACLARGHLPYTIDWQYQDEIQQRVPTLAEMTHAALRSLDQGEQGFLLQIEGGRVDHAAHANDAPAIFWDQLAFDDAIREVLKFVENREDTLVIITTDHGNANPGLNGTGGSYRKTNAAFDKLFDMRASYEAMNQRWSKRRIEDGEITRDAAIEVVREGTGIELAGKEAAVLHQALNGDFSGEVFKQHRSWVGVLGEVLGNHHGIGWTGVSHTADLVWVSAMGPGSAQFRGVHRNTFAYEVMCSLCGISHHNPTMTAERAAELAAVMPIQEAVWA
jgi:alkaline phosphatase